jgi:hypothetical protein
MQIIRTSLATSHAADLARGHPGAHLRDYAAKLGLSEIRP